MITLAKLTIFNAYGGDIDGPHSMERQTVFQEISSDEWHRIEGMYQDISSINQKKASNDSIEKVVKNICSICDHESSLLLLNQLNVYKLFEQVVNILLSIKSLTKSDADTTYAGFDDAASFMEELDFDIAALKMCDFTMLDNIKIEFLPTSTYQELAMSNGWSNQYLRLSKEFDQLYKLIYTK
jgi:hypothetical protein